MRCQHSNGSSYTLTSVQEDDRSPLISPNAPSYGVAARNPPSTRKLVFNATLKMAAIFVVSTAVLGTTLWLALPPLEPDDRPMLRIPRSFVQLQELNFLLKKYRDIYPFRILVSYVITYLFLQAFSLPGSMYLSILGGAVWGVPRALPLACTCVASGATLCYLLSAALGPALLAMPRFKTRLDSLGSRIQANKENLLSFLIVLRIAPLPPHWVVNIVCPHVGIGLVPFWISTWLGMLGVTVIHTTIGGGLDEMTSADDFKLISWKNFFGLSAVVVGVMIPVGLRYWFGKKVSVEVEQETDSDSAQIFIPMDDEDVILAVGPRAQGNKFKDFGRRETELSDEEFDPYEDDDEDIILERGPPIEVKPKDGSPSRQQSPEPMPGSSRSASR
ncbi:hypothetical protein HGRIS_003712 [Hohenbuehelia grisea]|uniref:VTT domain-containing protein n=1 Tax=Hohenbuehelia grisea TaxID=104357 RepID=A0ABR3JHV8_9AGAR